MERFGSYLLVLAQLALSAAILLDAWRAFRWCGYLFVCFAGAALMAWALFAMGSRLSVMPQVKRTTQLVATGPYRLIRHPMYTGLLLCCGGAIFITHAPWKTAAWIALLITLDTKSRIEERLLSERFPGYETYRKHTWRLVPFVY